jgi:AmmeMemoRadiSam system protein A
MGEAKKDGPEAGSASDKQNKNDGEDCYVRLARETLEYYIRNDWLMPMPTDLPSQMLEEKAGAFVSLKKHGSLRGCIGTIMATQENIAMEIMYNAISAGTKDPRFLAVTERELPALVYSVDILTPPIPVPDRAILDCRKYGVVVIKGNRRGLLLPDLEGVDTVEEQLEIACQKAGIDPEEDYKLEYFQVIRHG